MVHLALFEAFKGLSNCFNKFVKDIVSEHSSDKLTERYPKSISKTSQNLPEAFPEYQSEVFLWDILFLFRGRVWLFASGRKNRPFANLYRNRFPIEREHEYDDGF